MNEHPKFAITKSIVSACICKTAVLLNEKISEDVLNLLSNEFTDRIIKEIKEE